MKRKIWAALFALYCAGMLWLLFDRVGYETGIPYLEQLKFNLIPFHTIHLFWDALRSHTYRTAAVINLLGNIVMFVPMGFLLPSLFSQLKKLWTTFLAAAGIIITVELLQLLTLLGTCDIDDLILNLLGVVMGYSIHALIMKMSLSE